MWSKHMSSGMSMSPLLAMYVVLSTLFSLMFAIQLVFFSFNLLFVLM